MPLAHTSAQTRAARLAAALATPFATTVLCLALATPVAARAQESGIAVGSRAPNASGQTLDGGTGDLGAWLGKEPIFIEFWATWCPNCRQLEPQVIALQKKYAGRVRFVSVAVSVNEKVDLVKRYVALHGLQGEHLYDNKGNLTDAYDVPATSYVVVVNARGIVVYTGLGAGQNLEAAIAKAF